jgi:voltage-gated potassium channel
MRDVAAGARALFTARAEIRAGRNKF